MPTHTGTTIDQRASLNVVAPYSDLSSDEQDIVAPFLQKKTYHAGARIYQPNEPSEYLYSIMRGSVLLSQELHSVNIELARLAAGHFFGESSILESIDVHHATAHAVEDSMLMLLPKNKFNALKKEHPTIALAILTYIGQTLSDRLLDDTQRISIISELSAVVLHADHLNNISLLARQILTITRLAIPARCAFLGLFDRNDPSILNIISSIGITAKELPRKLPANSDPYLHRLHEKDGGVLLSAATYEQSEKVFYAKRNLLAHAIHIEDRNVGVVVLADKTIGDFTPKNSLILRIIASQISFAIEEAHIREEKKASEELRRTYVGM